jgi:hypothetical protein
VVAAMSADRLLLIELLIVFGAILGWGVWELVALRRHRRRRDQDATRTDEGRGGSEGGGR